MYQVKKHGKTIAQFFSGQEAKYFAVDKGIRDLRKENPNEEAEEVEGELVAPEEVYDFLKVIWSDFDTERNPENLTIMVYTLADTDCDRWLLENVEFGDKEQLDLLEKKYGWTLGEDLPEWLEETENRLLLIKELLEKITK